MVRIWAAVRLRSTKPKTNPALVAVVVAVSAAGNPADPRVHSRGSSPKRVLCELIHLLLNPTTPRAVFPIEKQRWCAKPKNGPLPALRKSPPNRLRSLHLINALNFGKGFTALPCHDPPRTSW